MAAFPDLYLLRHGETEWNAAGRLQGRLDSPLTDLGVAQARAQGQILARVLSGGESVRVSPSGRAHRTAQIALGDAMARAEIDPRLMEIDLGDWAGGHLEDLAAHQGADPHLWKFAAPGGESLAQMAARCEAVLADLTGPTVLVTHGVTSRMIRAIVLGLGPERLSEVPGGQGVVHRIAGGVAQVLRA